MICGAKEEKDEHGFPRLLNVGLSAERLKEVEGRVLTACRERVSPSIAPLVQELEAKLQMGGFSFSFAASNGRPTNAAGRFRLRV